MSFYDIILTSKLVEFPIMLFFNIEFKTEGLLKSKGSKGSYILYGIAGALGAITSYFVAKRVKKGPKYSLKTKPPEKSFGDDFENEVIDILKQKYNENVVCWKFIFNNRKGEIDAIVLNNNNLVLIEIKGWKGRLYEQNGRWVKEKTDQYTGNTSKEEYNKDFIQDLNEKCKVLARKIKYEGKIHGLIVISDECEIVDFKKTNNNVCNLKDMILKISELTAGIGIYDSSVLQKLNALPTWDEIYSNGEIYHEIVTSNKIEVLDENNNVAVINVEDISSIIVKKYFPQIRKNDIYIKMKNGANARYYEDKAFFTILKDKKDMKVSLRTVDKIILNKSSVSDELN